MSWVTVVWSMIAAACLTLAVVHAIVWWWRREALANVLFALTATATTFFAAGEMWMMHAGTPEQFATAVRWTHVPVWVLVVSLVGFVRLCAAFEAGALGYVVKPRLASDLLPAIRAALAGRRFLSPTVHLGEAA